MKLKIKTDNTVKGLVVMDTCL